MPFNAFKAEHSKRLDLAVEQFVQGMKDDPYEVLERAGAGTKLIDVVAERHVYRSTINRATTLEGAFKELDQYAVVFVESNGALSDTYMRERVSTWIQGWRRRLEKLQRENPVV